MIQQIIDLINRVLSGGADAQETVALFIVFLMAIGGILIMWVIVRPMMSILLKRPNTIKIGGDKIDSLLETLTEMIALTREQSSDFRAANHGLSTLFTEQQAIERERANMRKVDLENSQKHLDAISKTQAQAEQYLNEILPIAHSSSKERAVILAAVKEVDRKVTDLWEKEKGS